jgi:outer membrane protein assembly factor BamA
MFHRLSVACRAALLVLLLAPVPLSAQNHRQDEERPRVERIRFPGADALGASALQAAIATEPSRCRSLLLRPVCWATDWRLIVERNYLEPRELPRDELRLRVFYYRRGYREAQVRSEIQPRGRGVEVLFHIEEGPPTLIESMQVTQLDEVLSSRRIRRAGLPQEGQPLNLVQLDTAVAHLARRLGQRGYLDGAVHDTVEVAGFERTARVEVFIEPGRRATVGTIDIQGNERIRERTILDAMRLREGSVLRTTDIAASQRSLYESNLFHEARVTVPEQADSAKRLEIALREAPQRAARVGGGFNTIEFFQTEARFTHYNWLGRGRRLDARATLGNLLAAQLNNRGFFRDVLPPDNMPGDPHAFTRPTWLASAEFMQPAFRASANTLGLAVFAHRRSVPGIVIDRGYGADISLTRRVDYGAPVTVAYRFEQVGVEAGDLYFCVNYAICDLPSIEALRTRHSLSPLGLSFFTDRANSPLAPSEGYRTRLDLEHAAAYTASDFRYNRVSGEATYYLPFGIQQRRVLAGRLRGGWVQPLGGTAEALGVTTDEGLLHPRKRFYSGGSRSVRGYGENQLGPRILTIPSATLREFCAAADIRFCDPNATRVENDEVIGIPADAFSPRPLGGRSVLEGSVEYRFPVWGPLIGAVFVDGAVVGQGIGELLAEGQAAVTPGFGARFHTPVGPIRVDLGIRPTITERLPVVTETLDADGQRRLVRLDQRRDYDPLDGAQGIFRQVLARLTLHLSIGEAY